jgi:hypothetical protein
VAWSSESKFLGARNTNGGIFLGCSADVLFGRADWKFVGKVGGFGNRGEILKKRHKNWTLIASGFKNAEPVKFQRFKEMTYCVN